MLSAGILRSPNSKKFISACFRVEEGTISSKSKFIDNLVEDGLDLVELMISIEDFLL